MLLLSWWWRWTWVYKIKTDNKHDEYHKTEFVEEAAQTVVDINASEQEHLGIQAYEELTQVQTEDQKSDVAVKIEDGNAVQDDDEGEAVAMLQEKICSLKGI